jgi:hypothetical protein
MKGIGVEMDYLFGILIFLMVSTVIFLFLINSKSVGENFDAIIPQIENAFFSDLYKSTLQVKTEVFLENEPLYIDIGFAPNSEIVFFNETSRLPAKIMNNTAIVISNAPAKIYAFYFKSGEFDSKFTGSIVLNNSEINNGEISLHLNSSAIEEFYFKDKLLPTVIFKNAENFSLFRDEIYVIADYGTFSIRVFEKSRKINISKAFQGPLTFEFYLPEDFDFMYDGEVRAINGSGIILEKDIDFIDFYSEREGYGFSFLGNCHVSVELNNAKIAKIEFYDDAEIYVHRGDYRNALGRLYSKNYTVSVLSLVLNRALSINKLRSTPLNFFGGRFYHVEFGNESFGYKIPDSYFKREFFVPAFNNSEGIYYEKIKIYWW